MYGKNMFSDDSGSDTGSDTSSERSLSPSPPSLSSSSSFANPITIPPKSRLSPPSTTSSDFPLSPRTPPPSSISPHTVICAYPSWPAGNFLSAQPSAFSHVYDSRGSHPSSRISEEDLLDLEELDLCGERRVLKEVATPTISWEATRQPPIVVFSAPKRSAVNPKRRRRKSSAPNRKRSLKAMSPILEMPE
ncbi:MAG: hypothetical protein LQ352_006062 [Teloschistes flavicans]|nr:MAG: hypothetical protein LQ352_006062 [Teloschistes flavicans]